MFTKWKTLTGKLYYILCPRRGKVELDDISCPRNGKVQLENSTIFYVQEMEKFTWKTVQYFMSTEWKCLTGELYDILCPRSGKV